MTKKPGLFHSRVPRQTVHRNETAERLRQRDHDEIMADYYKLIVRFHKVKAEIVRQGPMTRDDALQIERIDDGIRITVAMIESMRSAALREPVVPTLR